MPSPNSENHLDENVHQQLVPKQFVCSRPKNKSISKIHQNAQQAILRDISCVPAYNGRSTSTDNAKRFSFAACLCSTAKDHQIFTQVSTQATLKQTKRNHKYKQPVLSFFCSETHFCLFAWLLQKSYLRFLKEIIQSGHCNCVWKHVKKWVSTENVVCSQVLIFCMIASHINFLQKPWQNTSMLETTDVWPPRRGLKHSHCDMPLADVMQQLKNCVIVPNLGKHRDHMDVWHD